TRLTNLSEPSLICSLPPRLTNPMRSSSSMRSWPTRATSAPGSGQPSSSLLPFMVSACRGQRSTASRKPSLSLSGSGQPSSSSKPSGSSASFGQLSNWSGMPSASLSGSGQPSSSSNPSLSSGSSGHVSVASGTPSPSLSSVVEGQPSFGFLPLWSSAAF